MARSCRSVFWVDQELLLAKEWWPGGFPYPQCTFDRTAGRAGLAQKPDPSPEHAGSILHASCRLGEHEEAEENVARFSASSVTSCLRFLSHRWHQPILSRQERISERRELDKSENTEHM